MTCITNIFWKRTYLFIEVRADNVPKISLRKNEKDICLEVKQLENGLYRGKMNLCIAEGRNMLSDGTWKVCVDGQEYTDVDNRILENVENLSNVYRYDGDKAYIVTFSVQDREDGKISIHIRVDYMMKNPKPDKRFDKLFLLKTALNVWYKLVRVFAPKKGNRILFMSENRAEITGNLKSIYDRIVERKLDETYRIQLSFRNIFVKKQNPIEWGKTVFKIACSDFVFVEDYVPILGFLDIDQKTTIVQTWHAGFGFKSVGYGRFGLEGSPNPFQSCHRKYTYGLIGNDYLKEIYSEVWGIDKESLLATGMPRLSGFLDVKKQETVRESLYNDMPFLKEKQIITFAPTYRGSNQKDAYYDIDKIDQEKWKDFCEKTNSVVLFKFHPFLASNKYVKEEYEKWLIDVSEYNLNDLFYITDVLITDYSSCFYDFLLLKKPVIFYVYDEDVYAATRGVHRPVSKIAPGSVCKSFGELLEILENKKYEQKNIPDFMIDKCCIDKTMTASDKVIDYVILGKKDLNI